MQFDDCISEFLSAEDKRGYIDEYYKGRYSVPLDMWLTIKEYQLSIEDIDEKTRETGRVVTL